MNLAAKKILQISNLRPRLALVLGSGFAGVLDQLKVYAEIAYTELPGFPQTTVRGHAGRLFIGNLGGTPVIVLSGRAHYYEGHDMDRVTFAVRTLVDCGVNELLLTNAAGGIHPKFRPGDFMLVTDHINFMGTNPLRGGAHFLDMCNAYDARLGASLIAAAKLAKVRLKRGVYLAVSGPSYETPAEIRAFRKLGADAVGMSTVPEVIVARQCGVRVAALSCITNLGAGIGKSSLSHDDVLDTASSVKKNGGALLREFCKIHMKFC